MSDYVLLSDSTTDLPPGLAEELDVALVPLTYIVDGVDYDDRWEGVSESGRVSHSAKEFYELLRSGKVITTSQVSEYRFMEFFQQYLKAGKDVVFLALSSGVSGTYHQAASAAKQLLAKYPGRQVTVIDSTVASMGEGLYLYLAAQKRKAGLTYDKLVSYMMSIRMKLNGWVTLDDLQFLRRSGRLNAPASVFGNMLSIKPIITMDKLGHLIVNKVVRGHKKSLQMLVDSVTKRADDPTNNPIFISHADCLATAEEIKEQLKKRFGTKTIITSSIGSVIGSHCGPGTIAVFFVGQER